MKRTKIFISCGQRDNTDEVKVAQRIADLLDGKGYEPYVAKMIQSLGALTEEIYKQIETSEYLLFIDFKRERVCNQSNTIQHRGSLFSHQELAVASYLGKECLIFRQPGLVLEGIQSFVITNPIEFSSFEDLLSKINKEVDDKWQSGWKDELQLKRAEPVFQDAIMPVENQKLMTRWYHASVSNNHHTKHARNCYAYILDIDCGLGGNLLKRNIETHWSGYERPAITILPGDYRDIDIFFYFLEGDDGRLFFNSFTTSGHYHPMPLEIEKSKTFLVKVVSDNFPVASASYKLQVNKGEISFEMISDYIKD